MKSQRVINNCHPPGCDKRYNSRAIIYHSFVGVNGIKAKILRLLLFIAIIVLIPICAYSQRAERSDSVQYFTLEQCIRYALQNQPGLNQSMLNIDVAKTTNAINLSGWLPQINLSGNLIHYNQLPTTLTPNPVAREGRRFRHEPVLPILPSRDYPLRRQFSNHSFYMPRRARHY